ncbi:HAMP domain-containing sensor histidine kinase [Aliifodinibius sp. S!AR15-10]|uniref:sensor histidine kinase n=1 Tax=Aliifodinibius sp. S!AR15-10 TaxID=2950437 RepID=UPI002870715A|nr:HAMP domain-containing sensor histidine kinase [Aliifodinibius sp. S!AR15-10]
MEHLEVIVSGTTHPVFIIDENSREIVQTNNVAQADLAEGRLIGKNIDDIVRRPLLSSLPYVFFSGQWYSMGQDPFQFECRSLAKIALKARQNVPSAETIRHWKEMIAVLLNRLRSPLTGMQGYAELMLDGMKLDSNKKRIEKIQAGIQQLFDIMDEMESLHLISSKENKDEVITTDISAVVDNIVSKYPREIRASIKVRQPEKTGTFDCPPSDTEQILTTLLENAVEHTLGDRGIIFIDILSPRSIKVSHGGEAIPKPIVDNIFYPFITSKAQNLGFGLTKALLYARKNGGSIFLTENNDADGISFLFCLPPSS